MQGQLELMNVNLLRQEDSIKKSLKKTIAEENKKPALAVLTPETPEPPRPPLPKNIPIHLEKSPKSSEKRVAINPSPSFMENKNWITKEESICIVKKTKNEPRKRRKPVRKFAKQTSSDTFSSTDEAAESSTSLGTQISQQFDDLVAKNSNSSSLSRPNSRSTNISRMSNNYQPYSFNGK